VKHFIVRRLVLCLGLTLLISAELIAQETGSGGGLPRITNQKDLVAAVRWRTIGKEGHLRCEVSEQGTDGGGNLPRRVLSIFREDDGKLAKIFAFETADSLLNVYPLGDHNARLFTTWVGGSAYHVRVFAFVDGHVKKVLDEGTKIAPEFLYDDQGLEFILISSPVIENGKWASANGTTTVFKWNGRSYDKLGTAPWAKRLQCLSQESCASLR